MKRLLLFVVLFSCISTCIRAQYVRPDHSDSAGHAAVGSKRQTATLEHTSIGGNFSLSFGTITYIVVAPLFNYHLGKSFVFGVGPFYQYESEQDQYGNYSSSIYGGRAVGMAFLPGDLSKFFLQAEYDVLNVPDLLSFGNDTRATIGIPLIGGGYRQMVGSKSYFTIALLFDLSNSELSPYYYGPNTYIPVFLAGFDIGL